MNPNAPVLVIQRRHAVLALLAVILLVIPLTATAAYAAAKTKVSTVSTPVKHNGYEYRVVSVNGRTCVQANYSSTGAISISCRF